MNKTLRISKTFLAWRNNYEKVTSFNYTIVDNDARVYSMVWKKKYKRAV